MNIEEAKEELRHTVEAYLKKEDGEYCIAPIRQRPVFLMGPPGIGKTQIMEQIARECNIGLVAYTITHHTRQSAVGLPFIKEEEFEGTKYSITEYTMSEIIASIYHKMKETGQKEGILFIDEINCVSETLAPTMLQFLQCKSFGNRKIPDGWIIVAAGNPPEYNKSVREFDMVTWDRVRRMDITADYNVWKKYAVDKKIHPALLSYLAIRPQNFYKVETDVDGLHFVTARGWEDFSELLYVYEEMQNPVTTDVVYEYLRHSDIAQDVAAYIELYRKYQDDYGIEKILQRKVPASVYERIYRAAFNERISVVHLLFDAVLEKMRKAQEQKKLTDSWYAFLKDYRSKVEDALDKKTCYIGLLDQRMVQYRTKKKADLYERRERKREEKLLEQLKKSIPDETKDAKLAFEQAKEAFTLQCKQKETADYEALDALEAAFDFADAAFEKGEEMIVFVTDLTMTSISAAFLAQHTCKRYYEYNKELLLGTRRQELLSELAHE